MVIGLSGVQFDVCYYKNDNKMGRQRMNADVVKGCRARFREWLMVVIYYLTQIFSNN